MDCPHCTTRNPVEATNCSHCRAPLGGTADTLVAELTPPAGVGTVAADHQAPTPPSFDVDVTLAASVPSSMAVPSKWSVPVPGQRTGESASLKVDSIKPGSLLANRYEIMDILGQGGMRSPGSGSETRADGKVREISGRGSSGRTTKADT